MNRKTRFIYCMMLSAKRPSLIPISRKGSEKILAYNGCTWMTPEEVKDNLNKWAYGRNG